MKNVLKKYLIVTCVLEINALYALNHVMKENIKMCHNVLVLHVKLIVIHVNQIPNVL